MGGPAAKEYPVQYFCASALAATGCYPLWRSAAMGQSGFRVDGNVTLPSTRGVFSPFLSSNGGGAGGVDAAAAKGIEISVPRSVAPYVRGFLPPYKGAVATVFGMTYARALIFYLSDYGHEVMVKDWGFGEAASTIVPPFFVSAAVQVMNQPIVRATVTLQDPKYDHPNVWSSVKHIYGKSGVSGLWHGTTAGILKTVPKYCTAIAVKEYLEKSLPKPEGEPGSASHHRDTLRRSAIKSVFAGVAGAALTNPLDVIRNEQFKTDRGLISTTKSLWNELGWKFGFRGLGKNMIAVALPVGVTIFCTDVFIHMSSTSR